MKVLVILSAILGSTLALPSGGYGSHHAHQAPAIHQATNMYGAAAPHHVNSPVITGTLRQAQDSLGQYNFGYESSDGQGKVEQKSLEGSIIGQFTFISPEGKRITERYTAGKGGFMAEGDHIPREVPIPAELARAYREAHDRLAKAYEEARLHGNVISDDGQYREHASENIGVEGSQATYAQMQVPSYHAPSYQNNLVGNPRY